MKCLCCNFEFEKCGEVLGPFGVHYGKRICPGCGRFVMWLPKPENVGTRNKSKYSPAKLGKEYCELCVRPREYLGKAGQLEIHHVIEVHDGGKDEPDNIWVLCSHCHSMIHHIRIYLNHHLKEFYILSDRSEE